MAYKLGEEIYKSASAQPGAEAGAQPGPETSDDRGTTENKDDDVIDAEYEVKDNK